MSAPYEPLTPIQAEAVLIQARNGIAQAQLELARANERLAVAKIAHRRAVVAAAFDPQCPKVTRGQVTVADREAWIDRATDETAAALDLAETMQETALEAVRSRRTDAQVAMTLSASVRSDMASAGRP